MSGAPSPAREPDFEPTFLDHQRQALTEELATQRETLAVIVGEEQAADHEEQRRPSGGVDPDVAQQLVEHLHSAEVEQQTRDRIAQLEGALARLDDGSYGRCEQCGQPMDPERLRALPEATLCSACKTQTVSLLQRRTG